MDYASNSHDREAARFARDTAASKLRAVDTADRLAWNEVYWAASIVMARNGDFESYMLCLERRRPARERFYAPRRKRLKEAVQCIQELLDDELDELFLSCPPRVGKSTLLLFLITYIIGLRPESSNLYSAFSGGITGAMYSGVLEILKDPATYAWNDIFPGGEIKGTNAQELTLDIGRAKRYHSFTARSLYGTLNGACDCNGILMSDDLLSGIEEAMSPDRLATAWAHVNNNLLPRAKEGAKLLWVGTRWATKDPAGLRMGMLEEGSDDAFKNVRWKAINLPALDENDESNFDYDYGVGFSTDYYRQRRASFEATDDMASWLAQYMGEPIDRVGTLFNQADIKTYNGQLPDGEADASLLACDVAWGGGDFLCSMAAKVYGDDVYVTDIVFSKADKTITRPRVVSQIVHEEVRRAQFERNNGGDEYREWVEDKLETDFSYFLSITSRSAPTTRRKSERILERAPEIRQFWFLEPSKRNADYNKFIANLLSYKLEGKNKNDDAPDCAAQLAEMINGRGARTRSCVMKRRAW